jgi:PAS domain S-box-containing protein
MYYQMNGPPEAVRVLHIDDNEAFVDVASSVLEREGSNISVETVTTPADAFDLLDRDQFDCLVSDYDMDQTNGIEFLERVRQEYPDIPFILFTGKGSEEVAAEAISAGATDYIQKEGDTSQYTVLANRIENLVTRYRARRRSEQANRRRQRTLERITDGFTEMDADLTLTDTNSQAAELVGRSPEELAGTNYRDLTVEDPPGVFLQAYEQVLETGEPQTVEGRSDVNPDQWFEERIFPTKDGDGIFVYFRDITDRKEREQLQELIIKSSSQLIDADETEIDDRIVATLRRIGEFEGVDRSYVFQIYDDNERMDNTHEWCAEGIDPQKPELQNLSTADFTWFIPKVEAFETVTVPSVTDLPDEAEHLKNTLESGGIESIVTIPLTRGGTLLGFIGFDWTEQQEPWSEETIGLLEVSGNIITNALTRKETIADRKQREQTLSALHEKATEIGRAEDSETVYDLLVDTAERVFDLEYAAVDVKRDGYLVQVSWHASSSAEYYERTSLSEEETFTARAYNRQETLLVDDVLATEIGPDESEFRSVLTVPIGEFGTFQTVSRAPAAFDDEDREFIELLVDHARVKLAQLQDKRRLEEQTVELERKNEQLEQFTTVVSHDLQNPLNAVQLSLKAAEQTGDHEHFARASQAADRMERLLEELLTLAHEGNKIDEREQLSLETVTQMAWQTVETGGCELTVETDVTLQADRTRLAELVENLVRNAVKHGEETTEITVGRCDGGFYVADDGVGIPEEECDTVFEPGYSTAEDGTGFGLTIVQEIAEAHGWEMDITTSDEGGARFEIQLD